MMVSGVEQVAYDELGEILLANGETRRCRVLEIDGSHAVVQLLRTPRASICPTAGCVFWDTAWNWESRRT